MGVGKRISFARAFTFLYVLSFSIYLIIGLCPAYAFENQAELLIPSINLSIGVVELELKNSELETPDILVGSFSKAENKELLIGHSTSAFKGLEKVKLFDEISYNNENYLVVSIDMVRKTDVIMREILARSESKKIVLMTCAGKLYDNKDASHRLIITAKRI